MGSTWDEMKQANYAQTTRVVGNSSVVLVGPSDYRVSLIISTEGDQEVFLGFGIAAADDVGVRIATGDPPLMLDVTHHGRMLRGPIYAIAPAGNTNVTVVEALHPCACLTEEGEGRGRGQR